MIGTSLIVKPYAPIRVLIVPDKFKGTLSASEACAAIADGWKSVRPLDELDLLPMSDGGDGFGEILSQLLNARMRTVKTVNAARQPITARWWWNPDDQLALIESAQAIGLARLPAGKFHPFQLDTFGLGRVLQRAGEMGAKRCVIGVGGSATNDGGFGVARALGWKFLGNHGRELEHWWQLANLREMVPPPQRLNLRLTVAVDVANPLLGRHGCSRVYGPQKGLRPDDVIHAEKCLRRLSRCWKHQFGTDLAHISGAGAAGGLGFGLIAFAGAKPQSGFDLFAETARLARRIRRSDLVITGEGAIDRQTYMGKGVGEIGRLCRALKVPCIALAGAVQGPQHRRLFWKIKALTDTTDPASATRRAGEYLRRLAVFVGRCL